MYHLFQHQTLHILSTRCVYVSRMDSRTSDIRSLTAVMIESLKMRHCVVTPVITDVSNDRNDIGFKFHAVQAE
jgi:hypothetical protein